IMLTASGILIAFAVGVVSIAQASAKEGGAGTGVTVSPSGRWPVVVRPGSGVRPVLFPRRSRAALVPGAVGGV
ncbi:hypothetical protein, partial [Streptomyces sp. FXJ7.023]